MFPQKFEFGDSWIDILNGDRPFLMGRVKDPKGQYHLVQFLIDPGSSTSMIPIAILEKVMEAPAGELESFKTHHKEIGYTNRYQASFEFSIAIGELDDKKVCHRYSKSVLAQLDSSLGIIGMDAFKYFNVQSLSFDYENDFAQPWRAELDEDRFLPDLCY